jgi:hypothetical protein
VPHPTHVDPADPDLNAWPGSHWQRWASIWVLAALFLASFGLHGLFLAAQTADEAAQHGQPFQAGEFATQWAAAVFENLQSEWAQLLVQALLITKLAERAYRAGAQSELRRFQWTRDTLTRIERKIDAG